MTCTPASHRFHHLFISLMPKTSRGYSKGTDLSDVFGSSARAKKKIKSIEKLLERDDLPADVRVEKERALSALRVDLKNRMLDLKTQKRAKKYHMVRFFERKKTIRKLKQANKAYEDAVESETKKESKKAKRVLKHCQVDVAYNLLFPKAEKYISLYPSGPSAAEVDDENVRKGMLITEAKRNEFKKKVEKLIDTGKIPFTFEDVLKGKTFNLDKFKWPKDSEEIDSYSNNKEQEEDDFFE